MTEAEEKNGFVPKLRFPEFSGEWLRKRLSDLTTEVSESVGDQSLTPVSISANRGFVPQLEKFGRDISGDQYRRYTRVSAGTFVYNRGNSLTFPEGCVYRYAGSVPVAAPAVFTCFQPNGEIVSSLLEQLFAANIHGKQLRRVITSGARSNGLLNISDQAFFSIEIPTPSTAEQTKVAECLQSLDELIDAEMEKLEALKRHKKGLLQQLFPAEGETTPRLRFPQFRQAGGWKVHQLDGLVTFSSGGTPSKANPDYWDGEIPWVSAESMHTLRITQSRQRVTPKALQDGCAIAPKGSLLILIRGMMLFRRIPICIAEREVAFNQDVKCMRPTRSDPDFLLYALLSNEAQIPVDRTGHGSGKIHLDELKSTEIAVPAMAEQIEIGRVFRSLEEMIEDSHAALDRLRSHKAALMQQLFPSLEELDTPTA